LVLDRSGTPIPVDCSDTGEFTIGCVKDGHINDDELVNISDLKLLIDMILHIPQPDTDLCPAECWCRGDLKPSPYGDGQWNVFDLQRLVCLILETCGGDGGEGKQASGENVVSIREVNAYAGASGTFDIDCDNQERIYAAEMWFAYDSTIGLDIGNAGDASRTDGWSVAFSKNESDPSAVEVHLLLYDITGREIVPGTGAILRVEYTVDAEAAGHSPLDVTWVNLSDDHGEPLSAMWQSGTFNVRDQHLFYLPVIIGKSIT